MSKKEIVEKQIDEKEEGYDQSGKGCKRHFSGGKWGKVLKGGHKSRKEEEIR